MYSHTDSLSDYSMNYVCNEFYSAFFFKGRLGLVAS